MKSIPAVAGGKPIRKKFLPFSLPSIGKEEIGEIINTLKSGWLTTGPKTQEFEERFRNYIGSKYALAVSSCTAGLHLGLVASRIKERGEVITTPYTFVATANVVLHQRAKPVFVDIRKDTYNIDVGKIESKLNKRTKAILPVHFAGQPCEMDEILALAKKHKLIVIEDAAHAITSEYKRKKVGTIGDITAFSFYATKNLTTGEGGMVTTNNEELVEDMRLNSLHGMSRDAWRRYLAKGSWYYEVVSPGYKYNLTDIQAAMGLQQLKRIDSFLKIREKYVKMYNEAFSNLPEIITPFVMKEVKHAWHLYVILIRLEFLKIDRTKFIEALVSEGIGTSVHFIPVHLHPYYRKTFGYKRGDFPNAEYVYDRAVSLPLYPKLTKKDIEDVIEAVRRIVIYYRK